MTHLCVSIAVEAPDEVDRALADAVRAVEHGADMVEWRIDALAECDDALRHARRLVRGAPVPCIVTVRGAREGGEWRGTDTDRVSLLVGAIAVFITWLAAWQGPRLTACPISF